MSEQKLLIIDDQWGLRKEDYLLAYTEDFKVEPIEVLSQLYEKVSKRDYDIVLLDFILDEWSVTKGGRELNAIDVIEMIGYDVPIIIVSNAFEKLIENDQLTDRINEIYASGYTNCSFMTYREITTFIKDKEKFKGGHMITPIEKLKLEIERNKSERKFQPVDIVVISALREEMDPFLDNFEQSSIVKIDFEGYAFKKVQLIHDQVEVDIICGVQDRMGGIDCATLTTLMRSLFEPKLIILIGVCGGRDEKLKIGDIVIPKEIIAYQYGKLTNNGFKPEIQNSSPSYKLEQRISNDQISKILSDLYGNYVTITAEKNQDFKSPGRPELSFETMGAGDMVIDQTDYVKDLSVRAGKRKLNSVEMESYGFTRSISGGKSLSLVIKSVMDLSSDKDDSYKPYAAYLSANFLYKILKEGIIDVKALYS